VGVRAVADIMGMPVSLHVADPSAGHEDANAVFHYLRHVDSVFSTYIPESETERINRGEIPLPACSPEMRAILDLCERTRAATDGYFDAFRAGRFDPSGIVKGYAIRQSAEILRQRGFHNFFIEAGGDIQTSGRNQRGGQWRIGIRGPIDESQLVAVVHLEGEGIATSGTYIRGEHIYDPVRGQPATDVASVSVIARDICEADGLATAAFAMGKRGILLIESQPGMEGLVIARDGRSSCTTGFQRYMAP
jgi:FAD:protein FMN transferase